jgi:gas vesicle protein
MYEQETQKREQQLATNVAQIFLQQSARFIDTQAAAARAVMRTHARNIALLGGPDWSALYAPENERYFSELLKTSADQAVKFMQQTNDSLLRFQQALNQLIAQQTSKMTAQLRTNLEQIGNKVEQSATEARMTAQQAADVVQQAASGGLEGARSRRPA